MRRPTTAAPPGWPARHAISPCRVSGAPLGLGDPLGGALQQPAADREAELGDLAGRLRGGGGELGAARARGRRLVEVLAASADAGRRVADRPRARPAPGACARRPRCRGRLERARGGGLRLRLRGGLGRAFAAVLVFALVFAFAPAFAFAAALGFAARFGFALVAAGSCAAVSAAGVGSNVRGAAALRAASASLPRPSSPRRPSRWRSASRRRGTVRCCSRGGCRSAPGGRSRAIRAPPARPSSPSPSASWACQP